MQKDQSDHLIKHHGFHPLKFKGKFLLNGHYGLDFFEEQLARKGTMKIVGYINPKGLSTRVILDTRKIKDSPFAYVYTYAERMHKNVRQRIEKEELRLAKIATEKRKAREAMLSKVGTRVYVYPVFGRGGFTASNGTVESSKFGDVTVKLDYGLTVKVPVSMLNEPKQDGRLLTLKGELNCLFAALQATYGKPFGIDDREAQRKSIQARIDATVKKAEALEKELLTAKS